MIVYRIENEYGEGPYNNSLDPYTDFDCTEYSAYGEFRNCLDSIGNLHNKNGVRNHPSPRRDGINEFDHWHVFGFASYEQLRHWFRYPMTMKMIEDAGFYVVVYENVTDVIFGKTQVAFAKTEQYTRYKPTVAGRMIKKKCKIPSTVETKMAA